MNLVNMAMRYIGPAVAERIASKLGIGGPVVNKLIAAALPALLGGVIGKSKSSSGLASIMDLVTGDNRPAASGLGDMFDGGGDVDALAQSGGGMLEGLLGGQGMSALAGALGRHAGVETNQAGSLLGMLAPAALGTIGNQVKDQGMDSVGLAQFLQGQAGNVAQAMPPEFASQLEGSDLFDDFKASLGGGAAMAGAAATGVAAAAQRTASSAADAAGNVVDAGKKKSMGILPLIIGLIAIALVAWFLFGRNGDTPEVAVPTIGEQEIVIGDVNIGEQFGEVSGALTSTFTGITDAASAEAALPQLEDLSGQITSIGEAAGQLSGEAKSGFQGIVGTVLAQLRPVVENAIASSGAGSILQPVVDQIFGALEGMAG
jgi:hypothetical protein